MRFLSALLLLATCFMGISMTGTHGASQPMCMNNAARSDCGYGNQNDCENNGCCWSPLPVSPIQPASPWCYHPQQISGGYQVVGTAPLPDNQPGISIGLNLYDGTAYFGQDFSIVRVDVFYETVNRLRVKVHTLGNRWEVPDALLPRPALNTTLSPADTAYTFSYTSQPFGFAVSRKSDGVTVFNTTAPYSSDLNGPLFNGLVFEDQYLELTTQIPATPYLYGLAEHVESLLLNTDNNVVTFWARDAPDPIAENVYGSHPFYMEMRKNKQGTGGAAHGVFLRNSNGLDVVINDANSIQKQIKEIKLRNNLSLSSVEQITTGTLQYRATGGILDFYIFVGDEQTSLSDISREYQKTVGLPHMPPFWSLGFHQCRWGYPNVQAIETVVQKYQQNNLPLDTMWTDIDYMDNYEDFSFDPVNFPVNDMVSFVNKLHDNGQHYVVIVDPGIHNRTGYAAYEQGLHSDVFLYNVDRSKHFVGNVWPGYTVYPSFFTPQAQTWWSNQIQTFRDSVPVDGLWIDMNEASNFCDGDCYSPSTSGSFNLPPYRINNAGLGQPLNTRAIDADAVHPQPLNWIEYNVHNLFGFTESIATKLALEQQTGQRSLVISRSSFSGSGAHAGHWLGDNWSTFQYMALSIPGILSISLSGIPLVGADICGFNGNTTEELCARWMALGSYYPFSRNHNSKGMISQEPYTWQSVLEVSRKTLNHRYSLVHYYNTLFYLAHTQGGDVARSLVAEFGVNDVNTWNIDGQFLIGSAILISPVLTQGATSVSAYLPQGRWYDAWTWSEISGAGSFVTFNADLSTIPIHYRGGYIIPMQEPENVLAAQTFNPMSMVVALDENYASRGSLFMDDGVNLQLNDFAYYWSDFTFSQVNQNQFVIDLTVSSSTFSDAGKITWSDISVLGLPDNSVITSVTWTGSSTSLPYSYDNNILILNLQYLNVALTQAWSITVNIQSKE